MNQEQEKWAVFWCELLSPVIYSEIEQEEAHKYLKELASKAVVFPNGETKTPSLSTLKRKLKKHQEGGFHALFRKNRDDCGKTRAVSQEIIDRAVELKKEQPFRSHKTINRFLQDQFGKTIPRSTLYWHLKNANATRMKLGVLKKKVRGRWTRDNTHDLWVGDFEEGPYVIENGEVVPTYLSIFIDAHSRYVVEGRYYFRQNLDVLIDSLIRALSKHGAPSGIYVDNAKVYHSHGLKRACHIMNTRLVFRPVREPETGGIIERIIQTAQNQFETEVRAGNALSLEQLNRGFSAWLSAAYHKDIHSEINASPEEKMKTGLRGNRYVDMNEIISAFMQRVERTVNKTFSDVRINNRYYKVEPNLRGDKVQVAFDPFSSPDKVEIYGLRGNYLGKGTLHFREPGQHIQSPHSSEKPKHDYIDLLKRKHKQQIDKQIKGIDYRKIVDKRDWPFTEFAKTFAYFLGKKGSLTSFTAHELESLRKLHNTSTEIDKPMLKQAVENASHKSFAYIVYELKQLIEQKRKN